MGSLTTFVTSTSVGRSAPPFKSPLATSWGNSSITSAPTFTSSSSPHPTPVSVTSTQSATAHRANLAWIAGAVACPVILILLALLFLCWHRRLRRSQAMPRQEVAPSGGSFNPPGYRPTRPTRPNRSQEVLPSRGSLYSWEYQPQLWGNSVVIPRRALRDERAQGPGRRTVFHEWEPIDEKLRDSW